MKRVYKMDVGDLQDEADKETQLSGVERTRYHTGQRTRFTKRFMLERESDLGVEQSDIRDSITDEAASPLNSVNHVRNRGSFDQISLKKVKRPDLQQSLRF
jgi:hypothetical protein